MGTFFVNKTETRNTIVNKSERLREQTFRPRDLSSTSPSTPASTSVVDHYHSRRSRNKLKYKKSVTNGKHGSIKYGPSDCRGADCEHTDDDSSLENVPDIKIAPLEGIFVQEFPDEDGHLVLYGHINSALCVMPDSYPQDRMVRTGEVCVCSSHTPFTFSDTAKNKLNVIASDFLVHAKLDSYRWYDDQRVIIDQPYREFCVYVPLLAKLRKELPTFNFDSHLVNSATAIAYNLCPQLGSTNTFDWLRRDTIDFFLARTHRNMVQHTNSLDIQRKATSNGGVIGKCDLSQYNLMLTLNQAYDTYKPVAIGNQVSSVFAYECRSDFSATLTKYDDVKQCYVTTPIPQLLTSEHVPHFGNEEEGKIHKQTVFLRLHGCNMVQYANTWSNIRSGLKRLLGARVKENLYRANARAGAIALWIQSTGDSMVEVDVDSNPHDVVFSRITSSMLPDRLLPPTHSDVRADVMSSLLTYIHDRVTPGVMSRLVDQVYTTSNWAYHTAYLAFVERLPQLARRRLIASIQHAKRKLRTIFVKRNEFALTDNNMVRTLKASLKRETAKAGKAPRLFVDYDAGCMYANDLPEYVKCCLHGEYTFLASYGGTSFTMTVYIVAKPSSDGLKEVFRNLHASRGTLHHMYCVIYSDDQVVFCEDSMFEVDIASNDAGQGDASFYAIYLMLSMFSQQEASCLLSQCMAPIRVPNPKDTKEYITIQFNKPFEGSGSTLTTIVNHVGALLNLLYTFHTWASTYNTTRLDKLHHIRECIITGAELNGHEVTVKHCSVFEQVTFLKHYGTIVDGEMQVCLCFGSILKNFGSIDDDLLPEHLSLSVDAFNSMPWSTRVDRFLGGVMQGLKHYGPHDALTALRKRFPSVQSTRTEALCGSVAILGDWLTSQDVDTTQGFMRRYGIDRRAIDEFVNCVANLRVGQHLSTELGNKVLMVDYDYQCNFRLDSQFV